MGEQRFLFVYLYTRLFFVVFGVFYVFCFMCVTSFMVAVSDAALNIRSRDWKVVSALTVYSIRTKTP